MDAAWSCPDCGQVYRPPHTWQVPVWLGARRAAQVLHAEMHGRRALVERRRRLTDPPVDYGNPPPTP